MFYNVLLQFAFVHIFTKVGSGEVYIAEVCSEEEEEREEKSVEVEEEEDDDEEDDEPETEVRQQSKRQWGNPEVTDCIMITGRVWL